jgi:hypothetical protein
MSKKKKVEIPVINMNELAAGAKKLLEADIANGRSISITQAEIKDGFCLYIYDVIQGRAKGFNHKVKGIGIVDDDMRNAFAKLNVHLAVIDDIYKHSNIELESTSTMHNDELALLYMVTGFKINGGDDNEAITILGTKYLSAGSRMKLESPKIPIDGLSSYKWYNELKEAADKCREEVELYHYGKYTVVEEDLDDEEEKKQVKMDFSAANDGDDNNDDFEKAKVD